MLLAVPPAALVGSADVAAVRARAPRGRALSVVVRTRPRPSAAGVTPLVVVVRTRGPRVAGVVVRTRRPAVPPLALAAVPPLGMVPVRARRELGLALVLPLPLGTLGVLVRVLAGVERTSGAGELGVVAERRTRRVRPGVVKVGRVLLGMVVGMSPEGRYGRRDVSGEVRVVRLLLDGRVRPPPRVAVLHPPAVVTVRARRGRQLLHGRRRTVRDRLRRHAEVRVGGHG